MSDCSKYQELICALVDEELNTQDSAALMAHIAQCPECRMMYNAFAAVSEAVAQDVVDVPEALHENIMAGVRRSAIINKNRKRNIKYTKSILAAAACFAVVIMSAVGISGVLAERKSDVITKSSEMVVVAEAPVKEPAKAETLPAPTPVPVVTAAPVVPQMPTATAAPTPAVTAAPAQDAYSGAAPAAETVAPKATPAATPYVIPNVTPMPIPVATATPAPTPMPTPAPAAETAPAVAEAAEAAGDMPALASAYEMPAAQSVAETPAAEAQRAEPAAEAAAPAAEVADESTAFPVETEKPTFAARAKSMFKSFAAVQSLNEEPVETAAATADSAAEPAAEEAAAVANTGAAENVETAQSTADVQDVSSAKSFKSMFNITEPVATDAPALEEQVADVTVRLTTSKDYEELAALLYGTVSKLPDGKADKTFNFIIAHKEVSFQIIVSVYGDKLYYSMYDPVVAQCVYLADCSQTALEKFVDEHSETAITEPRSITSDTAAEKELPPADPYIAQ